MDPTIKARRISRSNITKICNKIEIELNKDEPDRLQLLAFREDLIRFIDKISEQDQRILEYLLEFDTTEEQQDKEVEECENYRSRASFILVKIEDFIKTVSDSHSTSSGSAMERSKRTYKLPKIEIKKFNGEILEWLSFWSQFEKIHEDDDLHNADKFQYLAQAMVEGSRAKELVNSYPQTTDNYPKVIGALKDRFGKPKILKQVYVRELIKMIANNVRTKEKVGLSKLFDSLETHLRALESLGVTGEQTSEFLFPMVESILPDDIMIAWQRSPNFGRDGSTSNPPKSELDFLMQFLQHEVESEQQRSLARNGFSQIEDKLEDNRTTKKIQVPTAASLFLGEENSTKCIFCDKPHASQECRRAIEMSLKEKKEILNKKKACYKCLKVHQAFNCRTYVKCSGCLKQHYHLLCPDSPTNQDKESTPSPSNNCNAVSTSSKFTKNKLVLLKTILVKIKSKVGFIKVRILFDDGSQQSYIKSAIAISANCQERGSYFERNTLFGGIKTGIEERKIYEVKFESFNGNARHIVEIPDKKKLTGEIAKLPSGPWMDELKSKGIFINDTESSGEDIDVLIGADLCNSLILDETITLQCGLRAVKTVFGWTIMGPIQVQTNLVISHSLTLASDQINDMNIKSLWDLELMGIRDPASSKTQEDKNKEVQVFFDETLQRNSDGRYKISLPWVDGHQHIPNNFEIARKRLVNNTKKLTKDNMFNDYDKIFKQWQDEGIIEELKFSEEELPLANGHFIPHHAVLKPESKTTPVRPVFDASCKTNRFPSLNECLMKGPNLIELIPKVIFNFREGRIGVISDIRKAFLMIEIQENDQKYLMFLWWEDESCSKIKVFVHRRVVFGVNCSPFILAAVLNHHLDNVEITDQQTAQKLKRSLYVDNSVTSVNSWEEYEAFKTDSTRILADAKMELRQWEHTENKDSDEDPYSSVLGLKWNKREDTLSCTSLPTIPEKLTKRTLLATINKVFDPLGFLSPAMVSPKLVLQSTWDKGIDWDEELPKEMFIQYQKWCKELGYLQEVKIPRHMFGFHNCKQTSEVQIHIFNDASQLAYATAIFVRVQTNNEVNVQLIQAKARITPIQKVTTTRLELMGCLTGVRLAKPVLSSFEAPVKRFYWSDSTTALAWIKRNDEWGTFVGNRVKEIINETKECDWFHVPGKDNPADLPSRGCSPKELLKSRWWEGPDWLRFPQHQWPNVEFTVNEDLVNAEKKKISMKPVSCMSVQITGDPWYAKRQSYILNLRILAWVQRFKENCLAKKRNKPRQCGNLSMKEVFNSELIMVGLIQREAFPKDSEFIDGLRVSKNKESSLYFVLTKIMNRQDTGRFKQPLLLPHSHPVVDKIIEEEHKQCGHAGVQFLVARLREKFWIVKTRLAVKKVINKCVICKRFNQAPATVPISPLPENRVKEAKVFEVSGIDLAGPLHLKNGSKVWAVIFTCGVYRAVHMETVESINTEEFILALSRFIFKRGRVAIIYTDNGTNFVKTARLFGKLDWNKIQAATNIHRIQWIFIPPASPWWGGFWERLVRSLKEYLRKMLGQSKLNKVQLDTSLALVESLLNNRPLTYISDDESDLTPLTPAAFIQDIKDNEFPEFKALNDQEFRQKYKELVTLKEELRSRFRSEYLGQLVQRSKPTNKTELDVGDMVFVVDDKRKRMEWNLAKILEIFPGKDQESRVARIKTANGELTRPFQRLIPLEIKSTETQFFDKPEVTKIAVMQKALAPRSNKFKNSTITNDQKEFFTKSGRKVKSPLRFRFN